MHVLDIAPTGRAKCRGCGALIAKGGRRFGERVPNPYDEKGGETTHWYHIRCAAFTRPESFLELLASGEMVDDRDVLEREATLGAAHRRVPRVHHAERSPSARAACRHCREPIVKDAWRISLLYYEDGRFVPSGYIHARCARPYLETIEIMPRLRHFSPALSGAEIEDLQAEIERS